MRKNHMLPLLAALLLTASILLALWGNTALEPSSYTVYDSRLPQAFDGFKIAHISDLHNAELGDNNSALLALIGKAEPDIIVITGDLIDSRHTNIDVASSFVGRAAAIAPVYYVTGNHEARLPYAFSQLEKRLLEAGATVLHDSAALIRSGGSSISVCGLDDPAFRSASDNEAFDTANALKGLINTGGYTLLLAHRPEFFDIYAQSGANLVLCGHTHGGQIRLPFIGGVVAPGQGLFPKYDAGLFTLGDTTMIISRGLGNSSFPLRINNRPELVIAQLRR